MAADEPNKVESQSPSERPPLPAADSMEERTKDVAEEKSIIPLTPPEVKPADDSKALATIEKTHEKAEEKEKDSEGSINRDAVLARVATEKRLSLIKAWEESEKSKAENRAHKKLSAIGSWENSNKAAVEAELKQIEEKLEKKKAEYIEKMKNKIALIHKSAEEKKADIEAKRGEEKIKAEEIAAKYRSTGTAPKKILGCF
ncbi:remorin-like isoform X2 [Benincasa hispida]|uniref:remorin-like isoform X2 n=1 Tax=Benincasa hispida TaxID=102211 RepID=UPI001902BA33|nr:remorin-like isoform X2 [Benincasa hispida]